ncbi:unnamed protein product, partial [Prorocentrum cordatum]
GQPPPQEVPPQRPLEGAQPPPPPQAAPKPQPVQAPPPAGAKTATCRRCGAPSQKIVEEVHYRNDRFQGPPKRFLDCTNEMCSGSYDVDKPEAKATAGSVDEDLGKLRKLQATADKATEHEQTRARALLAREKKKHEDRLQNGDPDEKRKARAVLDAFQRAGTAASASSTATEVMRRTWVSQSTSWEQIRMRAPQVAHQYNQWFQEHSLWKQNFKPWDQQDRTYWMDRQQQWDVCLQRIAFQLQQQQQQQQLQHANNTFLQQQRYY